MFLKRENPTVSRVLVGFVVGKVEMGQVFSECLCFPCHFSVHRLFNIHGV
jgi:hypothetical protein